MCLHFGVAQVYGTRLSIASILSVYRIASLHLELERCCFKVAGHFGVHAVVHPVGSGGGFGGVLFQGSVDGGDLALLRGVEALEVDAGEGVVERGGVEEGEEDGLVEVG